MELRLKNCPDRSTRQLLERTFEVATRHLGIECYHAVVSCELREGHPTYEILGGSIYTKMDAGATSSRVIGNIVQMYVCPVNTPQLLETFCHEMTHVAQTLRGDLRGSSHNRGCWRGQTYPVPATYEEYESQPWEVEANREASRMCAKLRERGVL